MTKGGVILVKVKKVKDSDEPIHFKFEISLNLLYLPDSSVSYEDRDGNKYSDKDSVKFPDPKTFPFHTNASIRKAVLLVRYVNLMKHFLRDYRKKVIFDFI